VCQGLADLAGLIAVRDSDRDVLRAERLSGAPTVTASRSPGGSATSPRAAATPSSGQMDLGRADLLPRSSSRQATCVDVRAGRLDWSNSRSSRSRIAHLRAASIARPMPWHWKIRPDLDEVLILDGLQLGQLTPCQSADRRHPESRLGHAVGGPHVDSSRLPYR
jgi:hypothetical protein